MNRENQSDDIFSDLLKVASDFSNKSAKLSIKAEEAPMESSALLPPTNAEPLRNFKKGDKVWHPEFGYMVYDRPLNSMPGYAYAEKGKQGLQKVKIDDLLFVKGSGTGPKKVPGYLSVEKLEWDSEGRLAWTFGYMCGQGNIRFYLHIPEYQLEPVVNKYHSLTGQILEPQSGVLVVVPTGDKWGMQVEIRYTPTPNLPDQLAKRENAPGKIRSGAGEGGLFWAFIEHGFKIQPPQDADRIRNFVPEGQRHFFDEGLKYRS